VKLVLDTNVLVSGLLYPNGPPLRLVTAWRKDAFELVVSDFLIDELVRTASRLAPRLQHGQAAIDDFLDILRLRGQVLQLSDALLTQAAAAGLRDPNDVPILAMLIGSGADFLVSGDKDLLALAGAFPILSPAEFVARFEP
jgi:putative PIN family toxin of toxin-antitoxin system